MRALPQIQADILYLSRKKKGFFETWFGVSESRIKTLRREEEQAIIAWLETEDKRFRQLGEENLSLLEDTRWQLNVTSLKYLRGGMSTSEIHGSINAHGYLEAHGVSVGLFGPDAPETGNYITPMGQLMLFDIDLLVGSRTPGTFDCFTTNRGAIAIERTRSEFKLLNAQRAIESAFGDPFNNNSAKRKAFLANRREMSGLIGEQRVSP